VLIVEAMGQVGAVALLSSDEGKGKLGIFAGLDDIRFKKQVVPGDTLRIEVEVLTIRRSVGKAKAVAYVGDEIACKGVLLFALVDREE
jgi:3-hydroxyacyl-[acyl-carrier-protein] dehydratase